MNYLYFNNGGDTSIMYPASALKGIDLIGAGGDAGIRIDLYFKSSKITTVVGGEVEDKISLTITSDKEETVKEGIVKSINDALSNSAGFVVIADDANGVYIHENITAVSAITLL
jgi:hypothetical protein